MGKIADRYSRRIAALGNQTARARGDVAKVLVSALQKATDEQLYDVTTLPTTGAMRRSIQPYFVGNNRVSVGYSSRKARHARRRLNLKGQSATGGHRLNMQPSVAVRRLADSQIRRIMRAAKARALEVS